MHSQDGDRRLEHAHGIGRLRHQAELLDQVAGNPARSDQLGGEAIELGFAGQVALPEQVGDFLERRLAREVGDVEAPVGEAPVGAIEIAQPRLGGDDALEPSDQLAAFTHRMAPLWALTVSRRSGRCKPPSYSVATNR